MARVDRRRKPVVLASAQEPDGLWVWAERYLMALRVRNYSQATLRGRRSNLQNFVQWCELRSVMRPMEVTKPILEAFQRHLFFLRKKDGKPLGFQSQTQHLITLRGYFRWLTRQNVILSNPASELELPRKGVKLPKEILNEREVELVMEQPDTSTKYGLRDRAIMEVLYSTGLRRQELSGLGVYDIDSERGTVMVREGKGQRDRVVPIGERALAWVDRYVREARSDFVILPDRGVLFLTRFGEAFSLSPLSRVVRDHIRAADIGKKGSCHIFRHTMATLMLERGADIRFIQEMLGHREISSTQIYTQVSIKQLQEVHAATHPTAKLNRPIAKPSASEAPIVTKEDVLSKLNEEAQEEAS